MGGSNAVPGPGDAAYIGFDTGLNALGSFSVDITAPQTVDAVFLSTSSLTVHSTGSLSAPDLEIFNGSSLTANGPVSSDYLPIYSSSTYTNNSNTVASVAFVGDNSTLNLNSGTFSANYLDLGDTFVGTVTVNRNGGALSADAIAIGAGNTLNFISSDSVANSVQVNDSTLRFSGTGPINLAATINGDGAVTQASTNTTVLSGDNTYTGATTVSAGTLKAGVASVADTRGAFGNNSAVIMANVAGAKLDISGFDTQIGSLAGGGASGGDVALGAATLTVGGDNTSPAAYAGVISGSGGITKIGTGTQTVGSGVTSNLIFNAVGSTVNFANSFWNTSHSWLAYSDANAPLLGSSSIFDTITVSTDSLGASLSGGAFSWGKDGNNLMLNYTVSAVPGRGTFVVWGGMILVVVGIVALRKKYCEE